MARKNNFVKDERFILEQDIILPRCIICDIDGTIALTTGRDIYDNTMVHTDIVNEHVVDILRMYHTHVYSVEVIYLSGRMDSSREVTEKWLKDNKLWFNEDEQKLLMRKTNDFRKDSIIKKELYEEHIKDKYYVEFVLDDRTSVVTMWRELGLLCLQVYWGDF